MKLQGLAILLLTHEFSLRSANINGWKLVNDKRYFEMASGRLRPVSASIHSFMQRLLGRANDEGYRAILDPDGLEEESASHEHNKVIFSSRRMVVDAGSDPLFLVQAVKLEKVEPLNGFEVMEIFGLTPAEARVALRLAAGDHSSDIAANSQTSVNTVRAQIRSIFAKTGTSSQSELVAAIWRLGSV